MGRGAVGVRCCGVRCHRGEVPYRGEVPWG